MTKICSVFLLLLTVNASLYAQDEWLTPINLSDFRMPQSTIIDSTTHSVVLWEQGRTDFMVSESERAIRIRHKYAVRIMILDKEGFSQANHAIPLYNIGGVFERIQEIKAYTHHFDGQQIKTMAMGRDAVFHEKVNEFVNLTKFTLPNILENSIIDIYYEIISPDILNFRKWEYQADIPKLHSQYTAIIPALYEYNVTLKGMQGLSDQREALLREYFVLNGRRYDASSLTYIMQDIPAFKEEIHMLAPVNYKSAINFELKQYHAPNGSVQAFTKEWKDVDRELINDRSFGKQLDGTRDLRRIVDNIVQSSDSEQEKAAKIYDYIKNQIRWNRVYGKHAQYGVNAALERRSGNIADVNLALIAAFRTAGIEAFPVILSTRENGLPNPIHPVISDFNYVIAHVHVDGKDFFLDASEQNLAFGLLPLRCINGDGRIIYSRNKPSEWIKLENQFASRTQYMIVGDINDDGLLSAALTVTYSGLDALNRRNHIQSFSSEDAYIENQMDRSGGFQIMDGEISHLDSVEYDLRESFQISMDMSSQIAENQFFLNPIFINRVTTNPFNLEQRNYHVDIGSRTQETTIVSLALPEGLVLVHQPKNTSLALPDQVANYTYLTDFENQILQVKQTLSLNKAIYDVDEYFHLKEFYSRIIQHQQIDFTFNRP